MRRVGASAICCGGGSHCWPCSIRSIRRCAATADGVRVGRTLPGRGAWVCPGPDCMRTALTRGALARALGLRREAVSQVDADLLMAACAAAATDVTAEAPPQV